MSRLTLAALRRSGARIASITPMRAITLPAVKAATRAGPTPHDLLWDAVIKRYKSARREYPGAVPGRRFRLDIAIPGRRLALEVDGWAYHGRHKNDFRRDRERQNLLVLNGWRVLRFTAGQIHKDIAAVLDTIRAAYTAGHRPPICLSKEI
jgi:very-short-patch-repair endonuclease